MKNLRHSLLVSLFVLAAFTLVTYTSCQADKCANIQCLNGGGCLDGVCQCPTGYTGALCEDAPAPVDPCAGIVCQNGGTCNNGNCTCASGYEGTHCETKSSAKFIGSYSVTEQCSLSGAIGPYTATITQSTANDATILMNNFGEFTTPVTITGTVSNSTALSIPSQSHNGMTFTGNGTYNSGIITVNYTVTGINSESCVSTWVKQ